MNITEALAFDCVQANFDVLDDVRVYGGGDICDKHFALKAHDVIAILQLEIKRLKSLPGNSTGACTAQHIYRDLTAFGLPACIDYHLDTGRIVCMPASNGRHCDEPYSARWIRLVENNFSIKKE